MKFCFIELSEAILYCLVNGLLKPSLAGERRFQDPRAFSLARKRWMKEEQPSAQRADAVWQGMVSQPARLLVY